MIESVLSNNTSTRFKFIMTSARTKNRWPPTQRWSNDLYLQENHGLYTTCFCKLCHMSLKSGSVFGDSKVAKGATFGANINIYHIL